MQIQLAMKHHCEVKAPLLSDPSQTLLKFWVKPKLNCNLLQVKASFKV